jgi:hypothetical membrane protein
MAAPPVLLGGTVLAAEVQPYGSYDWTDGSISALAAGNAADGWIMNSAFVLFGFAQLIIALGLRHARPAGRMVLAAAGTAAVLLAAFPAPPMGGSPRHAVVAVAAAVLLAIWTLWAVPPDLPLPWWLRPAPRAVAVAVMLVLVAAYALSLRTHIESGVVERVSASCEALWLSVVVFACRGPVPAGFRASRH